MSVLLFNIFIMFLYWIVISGVVKSNKVNSIFLTIFFPHILFLYFYRDAKIFPDIDQYVQYFKSLNYSIDNISSERYDDRFGIGWYSLNKVVKLTGGTSDTLINVVYTIIAFCFTKTIARHSNLAFFSVLIFISCCFYNSIFVLRQWIAIAICILSIPYVINRRFLPFVTLTLIAVSMHGSAWVWFVVYFIQKLNIDKKTITLFVIAFFVFYKLIDLATVFLTQFYSELIAYQVDGDGGTYKVALMHTLIIIFSLYVYKWNRLISEENKLFVLMLMCALIMDISAMIGSNFGEFSRLSSYYAIGAIYLVPNSIKDLKLPSNMKLIISVIIAIFYILLMASNAQYGFRLAI